MSDNENLGARLEHYSWLALLTTLALMPVVATKLPGTAVPLTYTAFAYPQNLVLWAGTATALVLWGAARLLGPGKLRTEPVMLVFGGFVLWAAVATAFAYEPLRSLLGRSISSLAFVQIVACLGLLFLCVQLLGTRDRLRQLSWTVVISAGFVALLALVQQLFGTDPLGVETIEQWMLGRGFSTIGNPDQLGTFLVLPSILAAFLFGFEETQTRRVVAGACTFMLVTALVGTLTRGAWIAFGAGIVVAAVLMVRAKLEAQAKRKVMIALGTLIVSAAVALFVSDAADLASRFSQATPPSLGPEVGLFEQANAVSSDRLNVWKSALGIAAERPLTGTGPAAFELGWYPNAIDPTSASGSTAIADDPHSLPLTVLSTMGVPGLLLFLVGTAWALVVGARTALSLVDRGRLTGTSLHYVAWFVAAAALQVALLVAALSPPIVAYTFVSLAILIAPAAKSRELKTSASLALAGTSMVLALALVFSALPTLNAELALARVLSGSPIGLADSAVEAAGWNMNVRQAYFALRTDGVRQVLQGDPQAAREEVDALVGELSSAAEAQPREFYYPALAAQLLTEASRASGDAGYAEAAVTKSDEALAIMPENLPARVQKATALADLGRFDEMADTLEEHWRRETVSAYPGILYAQALALSGQNQQAEATFDQLTSLFPADATAIQQARQQVGNQPPAE